MALIKKYDDLIRCTTILTEGIESEFHKFVSHQEECRKKWLSSEHDGIQMKQYVAKYKAEKDTLDVKLKHARNQLEVEMKKRIKAEQNVDHMGRQIQLIRDLILDKENTQLSNQEKQMLAQSMHQISTMDIRPPTANGEPHQQMNQSYEFDDSSSMLSPDEYDNTEDDILDETARSGGRRKSNKRFRASQPLPDTDETETDATSTTSDDHAKRQRYTEETERTVHTTVSVRKSGGDMSPSKRASSTSRLDSQFRKPPPQNNRRPPSRQHLKDLSSNSDLTDITIESNQPPPRELSPPPRTIKKQTSVPSLYPNLDDLDNSPDAKKKYNTISTPKGMSARKGLGHVFSTKIAVRMECCGPCGKRVRFGSSVLKCRDCKLFCHPECRDQASTACFPTEATPKKSEGTIESYVPPKGVKVPNLMIQCVEEIEKRGMNELGLYRVPGNDRDVKELKEKFLRGKTPDLSKYLDIHCICGCLKDFIRGLSEPLVTYSLHESFMLAAAMGNDDDCLAAMYQCVSELSQANRDSLAYMVVHLQKVAESTPTQMNVSNLSKVFGPTLVGHRSPNPTHMEMLEDIKAQPVVVERLLNMPTDYWNQFLTPQQNRTPPYNPNYATPNKHTPGKYQTESTPKTPECKPEPITRLGPLDPNSAKKTPSRFGSRKESQRKKHFFDSPH